MQGIGGAESGDGSSAGDFVSLFDDAAKANPAAFSEDGALDRTVDPGFGDMPAGALMGLSMTDIFTHA